MGFITAILFATSMVWLAFHCWVRVPEVGDPDSISSTRWLLRWAMQGVLVPAVFWLACNLDLIPGLPPLLPAVEAAQHSGQPWVGTALFLSGIGIMTMTSYWAALTFGMLVWLIRERTENRADFNGTLLVWSLLMVPVGGIILLIGGWQATGFAIVAWLAPVAYRALPGLERVDRAPSYAAAIGKIKLGKYSEAEMEVIKELEQCESDFNGWMMLAELYAIHFKDFDQARQTIIDLCDQPDTTPSEISVAMHRLAEWYLRLREDPVGARQALEAVCTKFPDTHLARMARLRINQIPDSREELLEQRRGKTYHLPALHDEFDEAQQSVGTDPEAARQRAETLITRLKRDPMNIPAREELARVFANQLGKPTLAVDQLDLLLELDDQPASAQAEWLGLKAACLLRENPDNPVGRQVLEQILRRFPETAQALAAQRRIDLINERVHVARLGSLKKQRPKIVIRMDEEEQGSR
jgi:hypothetical protein